MWLHSAKFCTMKNFGMCEKRAQRIACTPTPEILLTCLGRILACDILLSQEIYVISNLPMSPPPPPPHHEAETSRLYNASLETGGPAGQMIQTKDIQSWADPVLLLPRFGYQSLGRILAPLALCGWASLLLFLAQGTREYNKHMQGKPFNGELPFPSVSNLRGNLKDPSL